MVDRFKEDIKKSRGSVSKGDCLQYGILVYGLEKNSFISVF